MCSKTPRFSYGTLRTVICACLRVTVLVPVSRGVHVGGSYGCPGEGIQGGYTGWVIPDQGSTQPATARQGADPEPAKRAPEAPQGLEWVGSGAGTVPFACYPVRPPSPRTTLRARSVPLQGPSLYGDWAPRAKGEIPATFPES